MMPINRPDVLRIGPREILLPVYFPSISSVKTAMPPQSYLQVLSSLAGLNVQYLISAFDLAAIPHPDQVDRMLQVSRDAGVIILMDSGNYESFWKDAQDSWTQDIFHQTLKAFPCDLAFSFDEQQPPENHREHVDIVVSRWRKDQAAAGQCLVVPIIHGTVQELPALCEAISADTGVPMVAVPERRLGDGVVERAFAVKAIRNELDKQGRYVALHLLGTGNPISIALYATMGADSFDGLEWCQTVVDHDTALLFHPSQAGFFAGQTAWVEAGLSFQARTLAHNLEFYAAWMRRLRSAIADGKTVEFCRYNFPERVYRQCAVAFEWSTQ